MVGDSTIVTGRRVVERYRLVEARSDTAWDAVDETLRRNVVVHLLRATAEPAAKEHFTAEARTLARLNHRNVVATYDTGVDGDGTSYRVDELPGGQPLELASIDESFRLSCALQTVRAVDDAHGVGLVHGALSSASILVDGEARVQVGGFRLPAPGEDLSSETQRDLFALTQLVVNLAPAAKSPLRDLASRWRAYPPESVGVMLDELAALPDDADTEPETPETPAATAATGVPAARHRNRQTVIVAAVTALVVAAVAAAVVLPGTRSNDDYGGAAHAIPVSAKSFDPEARPPTENEETARLAVDGIATSGWTTEVYKRANFANLKKGLGLVLQSEGGNAEFAEIVLTSPTRGWSVEVYVAEQPAAALSGWGPPRASAIVREESTSLTIDKGRGGALLLWINNTGPNRQVRINEVTVQGRT
ncbi:MAG TPA: protein kinase [Acidimicrobiales bacterium]|nr:protein kinase [Acidimicrobiales bacterium]